MKKLLILVLLFVGCTRTPEQSERRITEILDQQKIYYFQDSETDLCFAAIMSPNGQGPIVSITCVPCNAFKLTDDGISDTVQIQ